ncbi:MAG: GDP-mannose 4,6-dehydratase [Candidatus Diapherotrites archaeon]|nr:GDP-mannose 4,6-dehydratase [Candidatus Diapherotrites archaeon]
MNLENKNVLVTGGAGFIGSSLVRILLEEKANVFVFDNFSTGSLKLLQEIEDRVKIIQGDVRSSDIGNIFSKNSVDVVFHLAAEPYIPSCYDRPKDFFETNANGTLNVLLAAKDSGVKRLLYFSSSEVYGSAQKNPMDETHPFYPLSTYAVSKLSAERLCFTFSHEHGLDVVIQRQFNVFGPRETHPYIIPEIISQLSSSSELSLGNLESSRDFTFVEDAVRASVALMKEDKAVGEVFNCGTKKSYTVKEIAQIIGKLMGKKNILIKTEKKRFRPMDVQKLVGDYSKLYNLTGWVPKVSFEDGLQKTIQWHAENNHKWPFEDRI